MGIIGRRRLGGMRQTGSGCAMCWGMYGSGWRTVGTRVTGGRRRTGARGCLGIAAGGCCAAVPGSTYRGTSAPPPASGTPPATGTSTTSGSVLPGRSRLESLPPYLGGPGGGAPWSISSSRVSLQLLHEQRRLAVPAQPFGEEVFALRLAPGLRLHDLLLGLRSVKTTRLRAARTRRGGCLTGAIRALLRAFGTTLRGEEQGWERAGGTSFIL